MIIEGYDFEILLKPYKVTSKDGFSDRREYSANFERGFKQGEHNYIEYLGFKEHDSPYIDPKKKVNALQKIIYLNIKASKQPTALFQSNPAHLEKYLQLMLQYKKVRDKQLIMTALFELGEFISTIMVYATKGVALLHDNYLYGLFKKNVQLLKELEGYAVLSSPLTKYIAASEHDISREDKKIFEDTLKMFF